MRKYIYSLTKTLSVIVVLQTVFIQNANAQCFGVNVQDSLALVALYNATGGDNWSNNTNWLSGSVGTWYGVTLTGDGCGVSKLSLPNNSLNGSIPPEIGNLINLTNLELPNNELSGEIPIELGNLTNLEMLGLSGNEISVIPPELGDLVNLSSLSLSYNEISVIPPELGDLVNLSSLSLSYNEISVIPPELGDLVNLSSLFLDNNEISIIPSELGDLTNLVELSLRSMEIWFIPSDLYSLMNLEVLDLSFNEISVISPELGDLVNLERLGLSGNEISVIPPELGDLVNLEKLFLSGNEILVIPSNLVNLVNLSSLSLSDNEISVIPPELGDLVNLEGLGLSDNEISVIPPELGDLINLSSLSLGNNEISVIPPELGDLINLSSLYLDNNEISVIFPNLGNLTNLSRIYLDNNQLDFDDFIPHYNNWISLTCTNEPCFRYTPQDTISIYIIGDGTSLYVEAGDVANNTYTWYEQDNPTPIAIILGDSLFTPPIDGTYYCEVTNSVMTDPSEPFHNLVLISEPFDFQTLAVQVELKAYLEGAYEASNNMTNHLQNMNLLPSQQPYNALPWNYQGTESVNDFNALGAIVDWVLVELRDSVNQDSTTLVAQKAALLKTDGTIVDTQGSPIISFEGVDATNNHYVLLRHRNHLDIASAITQDLSTTPYLDFSLPANVLEGMNQLTEVETGIYAMHVGDFNGDGVFNIEDDNMFIAAFDVTVNQYSVEDCNLDAFVFIQDLGETKSQFVNM